MISVANPQLGAAERAAVLDVIDSGVVADGPEVRSFEDEFAAYCGVEHGVATANGTAALHAALVALGIGDGDRVVTTPFSFVASSNAIRLAGATPVFADVDPETFNLDPIAAERAVRAADADAILVVHLYGLPADMAALRDVAADTDVLLVEDAAQATGARFRGRSVGQFGDAAAFSFYPTKNITTGEGGMVLTGRGDVAEVAASYVNHGRTGDGTYEHARVGHNYRMTSIGAAIGRAQLERLPAWIETRRRNARRLTEALRHVTDVHPPVEPDRHRHAYNQYTVRSERRDDLRAHLAESGVDSAVYYPTPIPDLAAYAGVDSDVPATRRACEEVLSIPVHPGLDESAVERVVDALRSAGVEAR